MDNRILLCGVSLLVLMCGYSAHAQCLLTGRWQNELGSNMTISQVDERGFFEGSYLTRVSVSNQTIIESPLTGAQQLRNEPSFGFSVQWKFAASFTSWTGQCYKNEHGGDFLIGSWLLREETPFADNWKATRIGLNVFVRIK